MDQQTFDITLTTLTYGGDAMGRLNDPLTGACGRVVFVPFGLPGERVRVRLTQEERGFARGEIVEILQSTPERISARCKHFFSPLSAAEGGGGGPGMGFCGGCHYQHLSYESQLKAKAEILRDQLTRIGKIQSPPVQPTVASPDAWNYRNHVQFHLTRDGKIGYVGAGFISAQGADTRSAPTIISISECHLPESSINALWPQLEFEPETRIERVSLRSGADENLMLVLESESPDAPEFEIEAEISVAHVFDEHTVVIAGEDHITIRVLDREFRVSAASFFQVNTKMTEKMVEHLISKLPMAQSTILDVYCGVGLFSAFLAPKCKQLIGIESSESACNDFVINLDEFDNVELYEDFAENVLPTLVGRIANPTRVLVDPPRAGIEKEALDAIVKMNPEVIAYVSCDPSTLARDAARLIQNGYKLSEVTPFDLFPQTYHIESISIFERQISRR